MEHILSNFKLAINTSVYIKDPESSELGKKIISGSIDLIDKIGFEAFTFKKLADKIGSTEASIYRYFENKHKLLLYITSWYWAWLESQLVYALANIEDYEEQLRRAIKVVTAKIEEDGSFSHINEVKLHNIIIAESSKAYFHKEVDKENKEGVFSGYKNIVGRIASIISKINTKYPYANMLVSTVVEGVHQQRFFAQHLPRLTNKNKDEDVVPIFFEELIFQAIKEYK